MPEFEQLNVVVRFNSETGKITFDGDVYTRDQIRVPQGMALIVLRLENEIPEAPGFFPGNPLQWADSEHRPVPQPPHVTVRRLSDINTTIQVINTALRTEEHSFFVLVQRGMQFFAEDPSIVNQPPSGPPSG